jgi:Methyltransferase FkbM domain
MEDLPRDCGFLRRVADVLHQEPFTLVDLGCSGGLDPAWRAFGDKLRAVGFDPNVAECERLASEEILASVNYIAAFVGLRPDHPFARLKAGKPDFENNPWGRLSVARTVEIRRNKIDDTPAAAKANSSAQKQTSADADHPVFLPEFLEERHIRDIDFIKIDVDGRDFEILHSIENVLADAGVMGLILEVNFVGSAAETDHTFHNSDRFMRAHGFELFKLTVNQYSVASLPGKYRYHIPAQSAFGRPYQGDALYVRDLCRPGSEVFAAELSPEKLLKTAAIFAAFDLPDCAAEILVKFRAGLAPFCDVDSLLDTLAAQAQPGAESPLSYKDYLAAFEQDSDLFYTRDQNVNRRDSRIVSAIGKVRFILGRILGR